jgi:hypothetical protein
MFHSRKAIVVLCLVVVACQAILALAPGGLSADLSAVLGPLYLVAPDASATAARVEALAADPQPLALFSRLASRAPPTSSPLA